MNKIEAHTIFVFTAFYLVLHYLQNHGLGPEIIRFYGKDLILVPLLILGINSAATFFHVPTKIRFKEVVLTIIVCIIAFEFLFPRFGMAFERDPVDILCYTLGGVFYYFLFLRKADKHKNQLTTGT